MVRLTAENFVANAMMPFGGKLGSDAEVDKEMGGLNIDHWLSRSSRVFLVALVV